MTLHPPHRPTVSVGQKAFSIAEVRLFFVSIRSQCLLDRSPAMIFLIKDILTSNY